MARGGNTRSFAYDANGNVISEIGFDGQTQTYQYNDDNRMVSAGSAEYAYNALGQWVRKSANGTTTHFVYSPDGQFHAEGNNVQYILFGGQIVACIRSNQLYFVHNDHLGRPEVIIDSSGTPVWRAQLEAFDRSVVSSSIGAETSISAFRASTGMRKRTVGTIISETTMRRPAVTCKVTRLVWLGG